MDNTKIFNLFSYIAELEEFANIDIFNDEWRKLEKLLGKLKIKNLNFLRHRKSARVEN